MKGVILAGGSGSRLLPLTKVTNKHLLPVYDRPMIYYPLKTILDTGIKDIMIVCGKGHAGHFLELLGSGQRFGAKFTYEIQDASGGIAQALNLAKHFANGESIAVILGDNIFEEKVDLSSFDAGAMIFLKEVKDAHRFGVATLGTGNNVLRIIEKPKNPETNYAVTGLYIYDNDVFDIINNLQPSDRGELEITDVNNVYIQKGKIKAQFVKGYWTDAGTFESLFRASVLLRRKKSINNNLQGCTGVITF